MAKGFSKEEFWALLDVARRGGSLDEAERVCQGRDRSSVARNYNIARTFITRNLRSLSRDEAGSIAQEARYETTASLVQGHFLWYQAWREGSVQLVIEYDPSRLADLGMKTLDGKPWQVACLRVRNTGHDTARRCTGTLYLESPGDTLAHRSGPFKLHWVDTAYTLERETAEMVDIPAGDQRSLDVVFCPPPSVLSGGHQGTAGFITSGPAYALTWSADVRGQPPEAGFWDRGGACVAIPIALTRRGAVQAYLAAGQHLCRINVQPGNGQGDEAQFSVTSPPVGGCLRMVRTDAGTGATPLSRGG